MPFLLIKQSFNECFIPDPCATARCEYGSKCRVSADRSVSCVCASCPKASEGSMICGDDGVTYDDICAMAANSCREKKAINVAYSGRCGKLLELDFVQEGSVRF